MRAGAQRHFPRAGIDRRGGEAASTRIIIVIILIIIVILSIIIIITGAQEHRGQKARQAPSAPG